MLFALMLSIACVPAPAATRALAHAPPSTRPPTPTPSTTSELRCPSTLAQSPVAEGVPPGWVLHAPPGQLRLQRAAFYDGDPVGLATLVPDTTHRNGLTETSTWHFEADGEAPDARDSAQVWLACLYRDTTTIVARPLPPGLRQCTTVSRLTPLGDPSEAVSVDCR